MTANKKAKKITGDKAAPEKYTSGGWAKADDPIYSRGWTIAPNMSGRLYKKESPSSEDTFTKSPQSSTRRGRYYGPDLSERSVENALRNHLGAETFKRLQSRRLEARQATAEFVKNETPN